MMKPALATSALVIALGLSACGTEPLPFPPVPPPQAETRPIPPVSGQALIWRPGDWQWTGSGYAWQPGAYEPITTHSNTWLPGHWEGTSGQYAWVPGHWL